LIRIRFAGANTPEPAIAQGVMGVELTNDPHVIAIEGEKNGPDQFLTVERHVKPLITEQWRFAAQNFRIVAVETRAGCNYACSFCPVSRAVDPRTPGEMPWFIVKKVADELSAIDFSGRIGLFGNNEPLLDRRLPEIIQLFSTRCPTAEIRVLTNGTYASAELVQDLFDAGLSSLVINNYTDGGRLIAPVRSLIRAAGQFMPFDIRVSVRNRTDVLTTRAGIAPNKRAPSSTPKGFCALPFTDLHISYTGMVNLCCFDAYGQISIGHVMDKPLLQIWRSGKLSTYRHSLSNSRRSGLQLCEKCDYDGFRDPMQTRNRSHVRSDFERELE
jgi:MoaA/NifB/PqqE/SkfB family radical SAM enzyme